MFTFTGNSIKMTAALLLPVLKSQPKSVNLSHKGLKKVPKAIGQLKNVLRLELQGNKIKTLPLEFGDLVQVSTGSRRLPATANAMFLKSRVK